MVISAIILVMSLVRISGQLLDKQAEQRVQNMYARDDKGIIQGLQSITELQRKKRAILIVHGFMDSPASFADLVDDIKNRVDSDIYVPLLPFHGRDLKSASQFNNKIISDDLDHTINTLAKKYQSLTVIGMSYGGALLTALVNEKKVPDTVHVILYAPGFFLKTNTFSGRMEAHVYGWWRNYCNYAALGCIFPSYPSGDDVSRPMFDKAKSLQYVTISALLKLYQFDLNNRKELGNIHRPYSLIIAVDDNRVSYDKTKAACKTNQPYCHFYSFSSGKHIIHWGANKKKFEDLLVKLVTEKPNE